MIRSLDLRERALKALVDGMSRSQVCAVFGIHRTTLRRWQVRAQRGSLASVRPPGAKRVLSLEDEAALLAQLQSHPDATLDEHLRLWQQGSGTSVSRATLGRAILRLQWTRKKSV
jgi:transposase